MHWQMTRCEKFAFSKLIETAAPQVAIEIGTYKGGSLQTVSKFSEKVYSLDIDPDCKSQLGPLFPNVDFRTGDSKSMIADVLAEIKHSGMELGFVLIDGDHTTEGVRGDIEALFQHVPTRDVTVVFHDSFNPAVREGILSAAWQDCPFVEFVEVDFIPGVFHHQAFDTAEAGSMYGGLAVAKLSPQSRTGPVKIHQSQQGLFDVVYQSSCYVGKGSKSRSGWFKRFSKAA
ncbi:class I SAM-dependent methyltransferase [Rubripirellula lacrimiformis]|uniref:class I SAM-dependent methyltransferase n=1 Tax=Rubripirellula lacrimiformis TaxID=1930273 RepID=UPI001C54F6B5|nr:class I SAM-dependent methyltransferase [Rubripirellula lacrimiformis]